MQKRLWIGLATIVSVVSISMLRAHPANVQAAAAGWVLVNGNPVPGGKSVVNIQKEVIEFRDGTNGTIHLVPGPAAYRVCIDSPDLVAAIEAACAPDSTNPFLDVTVEDGRAFNRCLVETSKTFTRNFLKASKRITRYCLRCEAPG